MERLRFMITGNNVFISYSHADVDWLNRLRVHLKPLERDGVISLWDDTRLQAGSQWEQEIAEALAQADVAILMISADFLASDFITRNELPPLLVAAEQRGTRVLPVIISPCRFEQTPALARFQSVNPPSEPLVKLRRAKREAVYVKLSRIIEQLPQSRRAEPAELLSTNPVASGTHDIAVLFSRYRDPKAELPTADGEREAIAEFFLNRGETDDFVRIHSRLRSDQSKLQFVNRLLTQKDFQLAMTIACNIQDAGHLQEITRQVIHAEATGLPEFHMLVTELLQRNQAEFRKVLTDLVDAGKGDSALFSELAGTMTNMAEARKVAESLVQRRRELSQGLPLLVGLIGSQNRAELRKLAVTFVHNGLQRGALFYDALTILAAENQREAEKVLQVLIVVDRERYEEILASGIITQDEILKRLRSLE